MKRTILQFAMVALLLSGCKEKPIFTTIDLISLVRQVGVYKVDGLGPPQLSDCQPVITRESTTQEVTVMFFAPDVMKLKLSINTSVRNEHIPVYFDVNGYNVADKNIESTPITLTFKSQKGLNVVVLRLGKRQNCSVSSYVPSVVFDSFLISESI